MAVLPPSSPAEGVEAPSEVAPADPSVLDALAPSSCVLPLLAQAITSAAGAPSRTSQAALGIAMPFYKAREKNLLGQVGTPPPIGFGGGLCARGIQAQERGTI